MFQGKLEPIVLLLFLGIAFGMVALFLAMHFWPQDGQMFQAVAGVVSGFTSAFFLRVKPAESSGLPKTNLNPSNETESDAKS